jgi:hypothetical protein
MMLSWMHLAIMDGLAVMDDFTAQGNAAAISTDAQRQAKASNATDRDLTGKRMVRRA